MTTTAVLCATALFACAPAAWAQESTPTDEPATNSGTTSAPVQQSETDGDNQAETQTEAQSDETATTDDQQDASAADDNGTTTDQTANGEASDESETSDTDQEQQDGQSGTTDEPDKSDSESATTETGEQSGDANATDKKDSATTGTQSGNVNGEDKQQADKPQASTDEKSEQKNAATDDKQSDEASSDENKSTDDESDDEIQMRIGGNGKVTGKDANKTANEAKKTKSEGSVDMYRMYNPNSGEHFYTMNTNERKMLLEKGWSYEGIGWRAPVKSTTPVYRMYNPNAGDHHYTINSHERDMLVRKGWKYEGIGWYSSDVVRAYPLYRQYNKNAKAGAHNYTLNRNEVTMLVKAGWKDEGLAWYGVGPAGKSEQTVFSHNISWLAQGYNTCAPTSGYMIFRAANFTRSASGTALSVDALARYMNMQWNGVMFYDIAKGMNSWVGSDSFTSYPSPSYDTIRNAVRRSYDTRYAPMLVEGERRGGPHLNGHPNSTFDHAIVVDGYNQYTGNVTIVDPLTPIKSTYNLRWLNDTFLQVSMTADHTGIITPR
ncbi:hypothetical protein [Bifidobacterium simiiventris]|uniref:hypothetical protein n=1 Tax=Bifidobacterium simiiventris TaxID=2834434 RepID=UPI001F1FAC95|nr:hypothetical protein [Bifidobacterium simiiventris]